MCRRRTLLAAFLFALLYLIMVGWLVIPGLSTPLAHTQKMTALRDHGVPATGCVVDRIAWEGFRSLPELIYSFQTPTGLFQGRISVPRETFNQVPIGTCFSVLYLADDPTISGIQSFVEAFDANAYWSRQLQYLPLAMGGSALFILMAIAQFYARQG